MPANDSSFRQRQQGRHAAQLARRAACRACSTRCASASTPARRASPCIRAPTGVTSRRRMCATSRGAGAATRRRRIQHRRRSAARAARPGAGGAARPVHARAGRAGRDHEPGRLAAAAPTRGLPDVVRGLKAARHPRQPVRRPDRRGRSGWAASAGADRVELYTEPFARAFERGPDDGRDVVRAVTPDARELAHAPGSASTPGTISISKTSSLFRELPYLDEVSIGHAIISRALFVGLATRRPRIPRLSSRRAADRLV